MSIRIVTHCWAKDLPQYAVFLRAQLSSLLRHPCKVPVTISVCYSPTDANTVHVLGSMVSRFGSLIRMMPLSEGKLWRRAIGRNLVAKNCTEDVVWFTDVDHYFGEGCLDKLWLTASQIVRYKMRSGESMASMIFPETIMIHQDHQTGDKFWRDHVETTGEIHPNLDHFTPKRYHRAIGGVQIVSGDTARLGYLDGHEKWQIPLDAPFKNFRDDIAYRKECLKHGPIVPISLPNLYRLRHLRTTYKGHAG